MNVIMLVDNNNKTYHHNQRSRQRTLPKVPKESSRSKSPRGSKENSRSKSLSRKEEGKLRHQNPLSSSTHQLSVRKEEHAEVPVIVDEETKWISGVNRNTTCRDIITVILKRNNQHYKESDVHKYILCERWKKVDRPLRHSAHLLGIWTAWGQDRQAVRFVLKRIKKERKPVSRTDSKLWRKQQSGENNDTKHPVVLKPEKSKKSRDDLQDVNDIIKKILKQQTHLRSHIKKLENKNAAQSQLNSQPQLPQPQSHLESHHDHHADEKAHEDDDENIAIDRRDSQSEGKGYILKTFLENVESEDFYSHDSGIGSALATITDFSISKESEMKSLETVLDEPVWSSLSECIQEFEKIIDLNDKITDSETHLGELSLQLEEMKKKICSKGKEEFEAMQDKVEGVTKVNSSKSHEIKKNDIAISHMEKNLQGRQMFLSTIELDINRAESYAKRLQKEFEREFETVGLCFDILTVCNEDVSDKDEDGKNDIDKRWQDNGKELVENDTEVAGKGEKEKECKTSDLSFLVDDAEESVLDAEFTVSATESPFGTNET